MAQTQRRILLILVPSVAPSLSGAVPSGQQKSLFFGGGIKMKKMTCYEDLMYRGLIKDISSPDLEKKLNEAFY